MIEDVKAIQGHFLDEKQKKIKAAIIHGIIDQFYMQMAGLQNICLAEGMQQNVMSDIFTSVVVTVCREIISILLLNNHTFMAMEKEQDIAHASSVLLKKIVSVIEEESFRQFKKELPAARAEFLKNEKCNIH